MKKLTVKQLIRRLENLADWVGFEEAEVVIFDEVGGGRYSFLISEEVFLGQINGKNIIAIYPVKKEEL